MMEVPKPPSRYKKKSNKLELIFTFLSLILIFYSGTIFGAFYGYNLMGIFMKNAEIKTNSNAEILIDKEIINTLNILYQSHETEYNVCMDGKIINNTYIINDIKGTVILSTNETSLLHIPCKKGVLISMHNHPPPFASCLLSELDKRSFEKRVRIYKDNNLIIGVQCGLNLFGFYTNGTYNESLTWSVNE